MFEPMFESLRKATDLTVQMQQEMFKKWVSLCPVAPPSPAVWGEQVQKFQKKWAEVVEEMLKRQRDVLETQCNAGLVNLESSFKLAEAKDPEEVRAKTVELWKKTFECLNQALDAQMQNFQMGLTKWTELMTKGAA
jgi:hypothetical protein